jgi:hypothetical protein
MLIMQSDSNLVMYNQESSVIWKSNTNGKSGVEIVLQDNGDLVMLDKYKNVVWSSGSSQGKIN